MWRAWEAGKGHRGRGEKNRWRRKSLNGGRTHLLLKQEGKNEELVNKRSKTPLNFHFFVDEPSEFCQLVLRSFLPTFFLTIFCKCSKPLRLCRWYGLSKLLNSAIAAWKRPWRLVMNGHSDVPIKLYWQKIKTKHRWWSRTASWSEAREAAHFRRPAISPVRGKPEERSPRVRLWESSLVGNWCGGESEWGALYPARLVPH